MDKNIHTHTRSMEENFEKLENRLIEANQNIDASSLKESLDNIEGTAITIGCGGSLVVADYLSKVLNSRGIFTTCKNSRDIVHGRFNANSLFGCSYSGKTYGIKLALENFIGNKYLITCNDKINIDSDTKVILTGYSEMDKEKSFVSLSSTLIPIGEFLKYHENMSKEEFSNKVVSYINEANCWLRSLTYQNFLGYGSSEVFEIITGYDTEVASIFLESTLIESGLGNVVVHDKYSYCHGRSTINYLDERSHNLIYLINEKTEIDDFLVDRLRKTDYFPMTVIDVSSSNTSSLERQYELLIKAVFLSKKIANDKRLDLSQVNYNRELVKKLYNYKGEM